MHTPPDTPPGPAIRPMPTPNRAARNFTFLPLLDATRHPSSPHQHQQPQAQYHSQFAQQQNGGSTGLAVPVPRPTIKPRKPKAKRWTARLDSDVDQSSSDEDVDEDSSNDDDRHDGNENAPDAAVSTSPWPHNWPGARPQQTSPSRSPPKSSSHLSQSSPSPAISMSSSPSTPSHPSTSSPTTARTRMTTPPSPPPELSGTSSPGGANAYFNPVTFKSRANGGRSLPAASSPNGASAISPGPSSPTAGKGGRANTTSIGKPASPPPLSPVSGIRTFYHPPSPSSPVSDDECLVVSASSSGRGSSLNGVGESSSISPKQGGRVQPQQRQPKAFKVIPLS